MSVICTVDSSEYWQQLCSVTEQRVYDSIIDLHKESNDDCYIKRALTVDELAELVKEYHQVKLVIAPPHVSLLADNVDDINVKIKALREQLDAMYSLFKKHRNTLQLYPLSSLCLGASDDDVAQYGLEKVIDECQVSTTIGSVISFSAFNQSVELIKAYKKLQSCFTVKADEAVFFPDITSVQVSLIQKEIDLKDATEENERLISQSQRLLESVEQKISELDATRAENRSLSSINEKQSSEIVKVKKGLTEEKVRASTLNDKLINLEKSLSDEVAVLTSQLVVVQKELKEKTEELADFVQKSKKDATIAEKVKSREIKNLESKLDQKLKVEHSLRAELAELRAIKASKLWKVTSKVDRLSNVVDKNNAKRKKLSQDMSLLYTSELFDADWYLETYQDVKNDGIDPAEHYLLYGAKEGRRPSPEFDGNWYLQANPDVAEENTNPLLHYIKFGREEKRPVSPVMITFNKK